MHHRRFEVNSGPIHRTDRVRPLGGRARISSGATRLVALKRVYTTILHQSPHVMRLRFLFASALVLLVLAVAPGPLHAQNEAAVDSAQQAAQAWLELLDADEYEATWTEAAAFFQSKVDTEQWVRQVKQAHGPLGDFQSRSLVEARYTSSMPNAPEGEYVIAQYRATYGSAEVVETVSLKKEQDEWRVAAYLVRPNQQ